MNSHLKNRDTLAQLLVLEALLHQVSMSLQTVIKLDPEEALSGIFSQITSADEATREKCLKFLANKLSKLGSEAITKDVEDFLIERVKNVLQDVTAEELHLCMNILSSTKLGTTITGHVELVNLPMEQAELGFDTDAITIEDEIVERFIQCAFLQALEVIMFRKLV